MAIEIRHAAHPAPEPGSASPSDRSWPGAMVRGAALRCPACGEGHIYSGFLKVADACPACGEELHHQRADDAPPYFTMMIVGHVIVAGVLLLEDLYAPESWVHAVIWGPLIVLMSLWLLPRVKGALVGLQWALRMHGFSGNGDDAPEAEPAAGADRG
ncbi:MAG: DUF983 domain-containing protein [Hyphomicrobiaceae bacterium]|nr:DUF983 domain-containing protein [Hyphomicrobiaceae bacterium]